MDRKTVIGFILLGVLIIAFFFMQSRFANQQRVEQAKKQATADSIKRVEDSLNLLKNPVIEEPKQATLSDAAALLPDSILKGKTAEQIAKLEDSIQSLKKLNEFGQFSNVANGTEKLDSIENEVIKVVFTNKGGHIVKAELKQYKNYHGGLVDLISGDENRFNYNFKYNNDKMINSEDLYFTAAKSSDGKAITFTADLGDGSAFIQSYKFTGTDYLIDYNVQLKGFDDIISRQDPIIILNWKNIMQEQEKALKYERQYSKLYFSTAEGDVDYKNTNGELKFEEPVKWVSCQQQFFNTTLIAKNNFDRKGKIEVFSDDTTDYVKSCNTELYLTFNGKSDYQVPMQWYIAPNDYQSLNALDLGMETIIPTGSGFIGWINTHAIIPLFNWLSGMITNYGLIILLLTLIIKLALTPLTYRSYLSMAKMRVLNPELTELREKYADDQARLGQEQLKLYRKAGVNPMGGCIPTLLSMPILIAMFRLFPGTIDLRQQSFLWADDLSTYDDIISWGTSIPLIGNHISIFCILMTLSSVLYIRMNMQNTAQLQGPMKTIQYLTPVFFFFFLNSSPAGLTYYYFVSNLVTFAQQWSIRRFFINDDDIHKKIQENKAKPEKQKSGFAKRLEDAMKQQQKMREAQQNPGKKKK